MHPQRHLDHRSDGDMAVTDLDLAAIKARYEAARLPYSAAYHVGDIHPAYNDVPALLARIAELEAERDELRAERILARERSDTDD